MKTNILIALVVCFFCACNEDDTTITPDTNCDSTTSVFDINLNPSECNVDIEAVLGVTSQYVESVSGNTRTINVNGVANHNVGSFPNSGNPNTISVSNATYTMTTNPSIATNSTSGQGHVFGVLFSGVVVDIYTAEFFIGSSGVNMAWNMTALQSTRDLGLDCNNAHVQPTGKYHYHGTPSKYIDDLGTADGSQMIKIGYAGDGFPIYYKYGYSADGVTIVEQLSGYQLKTEDRGGDGASAPNGCPDGTYFQDYEYVSGISDLDECNGRFGKTPESDNEYYYVITDNWPSGPLCFSGTPDASFRF